MNPPTSSMAPMLVDYHKVTTNIRSRILKNQEERIQLEHKLRSLSNVESRLKQKQQVEQVQSYFEQLDNESQRAQQRNLSLLNDLTQAERNLNQLRIDAERLIQVKSEYFQYLESNYPNWQRNSMTGTSTTINSNINNADYLRQQHVDGNFRPTGSISQLVNAISTNPLHQHFNDDSKIRVDPTSLVTPRGDNKDYLYDDQSSSDVTSNTFSRSKHSSSLRMELQPSGLFFLLDYIEKELADTIDKKKFYHHDPPTIAQKRTVLDIANGQEIRAVKDLDATTTSMVVLDQLPSTIRRITNNKGLLTEDILSLNIVDLDKDTITKMLPEHERSIWIRLVDHFTRLLKLHIMNSQALANKFAPTLLPNNTLFLHDKAKDLLKHIIEKVVGAQHTSSDNNAFIDKRNATKSTIPSTSSSWLDKVKSNEAMYDDDYEDDETSSSSDNTKGPTSNVKSTNSTPRKNVVADDSDLEFYS